MLEVPQSLQVTVSDAKKYPNVYIYVSVNELGTNFTVNDRKQAGGRNVGFSFAKQNGMERSPWVVRHSYSHDGDLVKIGVDLITRFFKKLRRDAAEDAGISKFVNEKNLPTTGDLELLKEHKVR